MLSERERRFLDDRRVAPLSEAECVRLINACEPAFRNLVCGALLTGCRYSELTGMHVADFNADAGVVTVRHSKAGTGTRKSHQAPSRPTRVAQEKWLRLEGDFNERFTLVARPRHFGGRQWYFMCPAMNRPVSVLWRPPGARRFRSRQAWGRQVAYPSQFSDWTTGRISERRASRRG